MKENKNVVYQGHILDDYIIDRNGCVKNIISNNICKSFELLNNDKVNIYVSLKIN